MSWVALVLLKGGMRIHQGVADLPRNGGSAELLAGVVILNWDEQLSSAFKKPWMTVYKSMIVPKSSHRAVRGTKL